MTVLVLLKGYIAIYIGIQSISFCFRIVPDPANMKMCIADTCVCKTQKGICLCSVVQECAGGGCSAAAADIDSPGDIISLEQSNGLLSLVVRLDSEVPQSILHGSVSTLLRMSLFDELGASL